MITITDKFKLLTGILALTLGSLIWQVLLMIATDTAEHGYILPGGGVIIGFFISATGVLFYMAFDDIKSSIKWVS